MGLFDGGGGGGGFDWKGGAAGAGVGTLLGGPMFTAAGGYLGGTDQGKQIASGIGGGLSAMNPFHKPDFQSLGQNKMPPMVAGVGGPKGYVASQLNMGGDPFKQAQLATIQKLQDQASGKGPSVATQAMQQQTDANIASQMAMANSARGGFNPNLARAAMQQGATANASLVNQAASARVNEQLQASQVLGQIAGQGRQGDINIANANAGFDQASHAQLADLQGKYAAMGIDVQKANMLAQMDLMKMNNSNIMANNQMSMNAHQQQQNQIQGFMGNVGSMFGGMSTLMGGMGNNSAAMGPNGSTGQGSNSVSGGTNPNFMGPPTY